jgi:hypothetical protein
MLMVEVAVEPDWTVIDEGLAVGKKSAGKTWYVCWRVTPLLVPITNKI